MLENEQEHDIEMGVRETSGHCRCSVDRLGGLGCPDRKQVELRDRIPLPTQL